jgi:oxalate decarboxylase/phosphoglucose isomerase-like protein (cupin superfamily)
MLVENCRLLEFPTITDERGCLTFIEAERHVPFPVKRVFYLYDVTTGESRGGHAHKELHQVLICLSGSFDVLVNDGITQRCIHLNQPSTGLYIPPLIWDTEMNFEPGSVCMVLASAHYSEADYYREYKPYLEASTAARMAAK